MNEEEKRLAADREKKEHWRRWGPYLSERQWGTVREDYSPDGDAWNYFPFDQAALRAYRWGEDGILGISDNHQRVCFSFAFWNEKDSILKERLFGLSNTEGNHGEDVKEYYYYLDSTPTHSYMRGLYKYPQRAFPYESLKAENKKRTLKEGEFELIDTGIFDEDRYFDLFIEYAKGGPEDILIQLTIENRSNEGARLHVIPQLWFRNTWSWKKKEKPGMIQGEDHRFTLEYRDFGKRFFYFEGAPQFLFTENESNYQKLWGVPNPSAFVKDAFQEAIVYGNKNALNPERQGTKSGLHYVLDIPAKGKAKIRLRLTDQEIKNPFSDFDSLIQKRGEETDLFYEDLALNEIPEDRKKIQRQALSGMLWSKQFYHYVVEDWLTGDEPPPPPESRKKIRNFRWRHVYNDDILSMPDKWEYPWYAQWDLAFHCIALSLVDPDFAKRQLSLLTREWYMHPNGQVPAYEWNFEDVNPPVLAWAAWRVYKIEQRKHGREDRAFLEQIFQKLVMNFTWWVNRKDADGRNVFEGGFLGLDNISLFNRSEQLPEGGKLTQSDATSWMAMFCLNMWAIAIELAIDEPGYEDMVSKFYEHFLFIADAINFQHLDTPPLWNEEDGFYYDLLHKKDGSFLSLKIRSLVGLIPLLAVATLDEKKLEALPEFNKRFFWFLGHRNDLCSKVACMTIPGANNRRLLAILNRDRLKKILEKMLDEKEFLSPFGIRSISKFHEDHPFSLKWDSKVYRVDYEPAESTTRLFGGNSNWRGPIWFPLNYLIIEALQKFDYYFGETFKVECPTGSGNLMTLKEVAEEISLRLMKIFDKDSSNQRPVFGGAEKFQSDPHFRDYLLFYEYYHGEDGSGLGASHQTGWTGLIAKLIQQSGKNL